MFLENALYFKNKNLALPIQLPEEITSKSIKTLLLFLEIGCKNFIDHELPNLPYPLIFSTLVLSKTFDYDELSIPLIKHLYTSCMTADNCVELNNLSCNHLANYQTGVETEGIQEWKNLFNLSIDACAVYFSEIKQHIEKSQIQEYIMEEIIERNLKYDRYTFNNKTIEVIEKLCNLRQASNVFQLLKCERDQIITQEKDYLSSRMAKQSLTWTQQNLKGNFFKESDSFAIEGLNWILSVGSFPQNDPAINVFLKSTNAMPKEYFNKDQFFLPSNNHGSQLDYIEDKKEDPQNPQQVTPPSHVIMSYVSAVRCNEDTAWPEPQLECFIISSKSPNLVRKYYSSVTTSGNQFDLEVKIYFKMKYTASAILTYISFNFDTLHRNPDIGMLQKKELLLLLKHKYFNVQTEYQALSGVCLWFKQNQTESLKEILDNINWHYITIANIKAIWKYHPYMRKNQEFVAKLRTEILSKALIKDIQEYAQKMKQPRRSYQFKVGQEGKEILAGQKYIESLVDVLLTDDDVFQNDQSCQIKPEVRDIMVQNELVKPPVPEVKPKLISQAIQSEKQEPKGVDAEMQTIPDFIKNVRQRHRDGEYERTVSLHMSNQQNLTEDSQIIVTQNSDLEMLNDHNNNAIRAASIKHGLSIGTSQNISRQGGDFSSQVEKTSIQSNSSLIKGFDKIDKIIEDKCIAPIMGSCSGFQIEKYSGPKSNYSTQEKRSPRVGSHRSMGRASSFRQDDKSKGNPIFSYTSGSCMGIQSSSKKQPSQQKDEERQRKLEKERQIEMLMNGLKNVPMPNSQGSNRKVFK